MQGSVGIAVMGASGRMGRMLIEVINDSAAAHLVAVTERPGHDWAGRDLGEAMGGAACLLTGVEDPSTNALGEDESLHLEDFTRACLSEAFLFHELANRAGAIRRRS